MAADQPPPAAPRLNAQQERLLRLVAEGTTSSKALAVETGLSPRSIDTYLHGAARELGCEGRAAAAARFVELEREKSQPASQLITKRLAERLRTAVSGATRAAARFLRGPPLGGSTHSGSPSFVALQILRVGVIGMVGITALVVFVLGFLRAFS